MNNKHIIFLTMLHFTSMTIGMDLTKCSPPHETPNLIILPKKKSEEAKILREKFAYILNGKEWWYLDKNLLDYDEIPLANRFNSGMYVCVSSHGRNALIFDSTYEKIIFSFPHNDPINSAVFNPTGTHLATGSDDGKARIFDIITQKEIVSFSHGNAVSLVRFNPTGIHLATESWDIKANIFKAHIFDIATQKEIASFPHDHPLNSICLNSAGTHLATETVDKKARIFNIATQKEIASFSNIHSICFNPAGTHLAIESRDNKVYIFDIATQKEIASFSHNDLVKSVRFNSAGTRLKIGSYGMTIKSSWGMAIESWGMKARIFAHHKDYTPEQLLLKQALTTWLLIEKPDKAIDSWKLLLTDVALKCCIKRAELDRIWATFPLNMQKALWRTMKYKIQQYGKDSNNCCIS